MQTKLMLRHLRFTLTDCSRGPPEARVLGGERRPTVCVAILTVMNKPILLLSAALAASLAMTFIYGREVQRERARADALAARLGELEPLERGDGATPVLAVEFRSDAQSALVPAVERAALPVMAGNASEQPRPVKDYPGTLQTRRQVERLQEALDNSTPLQEYQIRALIAALDAVRRESGEAQPIGTRDTNDRVVRAAADILFESQLEVFIGLLEREHAGHQ